MKRLSTVSAPRAKKDVLFIERLKKNDRQSFVVYSPCLRGFYTHWTGERTVPCFEDHDLCQGGHKEETLRENFLVHAWSMKKSKQVFVYLTPTAAEQLLSQLPKSGTLRGQRITLTRTAADNGRLNVQLDETAARTGHMPPELDPYRSIMNFLKCPVDDDGPMRSLGTIPADIEEPAA